MDRKIFWFWMLLGKSTNLQEIALYIQSAPTNSFYERPEYLQCFTNGQVDFSLYLKNLQIYKELPMDRRIFWFWMLLGKSTNLQGITLYIQSAPTNSFYEREEYLEYFAYGQVDFWVEKSTNLQGIANGQEGFLVLEASGKFYKSTRNCIIPIVSSY